MPQMAVTGDDVTAGGWVTTGGWTEGVLKVVNGSNPVKLTAVLFMEAGYLTGVELSL